MMEGGEASLAIPEVLSKTIRRQIITIFVQRPKKKYWKIPRFLVLVFFTKSKKNKAIFLLANIK